MADDVPVPLPGQDDKKKKKKADKQRGAWISFAGRIVAQIVGALASVVLGVFVLQKSQASKTPAADAPARAAAGGAADRAVVSARRPGESTLAVLPLGNLSGRPDQEYFVEGMAEALTASLAQVDGLRVISRTSTMRYKTDPPPIPEIARALGADLVIEGSVLQADGNVRITAQLIDGATDEHLWAQSYTRPLKDVIALQDAVATAIATPCLRNRSIGGTFVSRRK
jgi:TolB-like protein